MLPPGCAVIHGVQSHLAGIVAGQILAHDNLGGVDAVNSLAFCCGGAAHIDLPAVAGVSAGDAQSRSAASLQKHSR
jgi:hypothetical protein